MINLKRLAKNAARVIAPNWVSQLEERHWLRKQAKQLRRDFQRGKPAAECVDALIGHPVFQANQKRAEILMLVHAIEEMRPRLVCEIGSAGGGTLFLLCQFAARDASFLSIDIGFSKAQLSAYPLFASDGQRVTCLRADSHQASTLKYAKAWLRNKFFDFLFIDGDHSLSGVSQDYEYFGPLVRPDGLIGFHDIHPDFFTRFGKKTANDVGEVPAFWSSLKEKQPSAEEFIESKEQDGYGIGLIRKTGA